IRVYAPDGTEVYGGDLYSASVTAKDSNGNELGLTYANPSPPGVYNPVTDTLGRTVVKPVSYTNPMTVQVLNSQGGTSNYVITTATIPVSTDFQQINPAGWIFFPFVIECNTNCTVEVIQSIGL